MKKVTAFIIVLVVFISASSVSSYGESLCKKQCSTIELYGIKACQEVTERVKKIKQTVHKLVLDQEEKKCWERKDGKWRACNNDAMMCNDFIAETKAECKKQLNLDIDKYKTVENERIKSLDQDELFCFKSVENQKKECLKDC